MKFPILSGQPVLEAEPSARTMSDLEDAAFDASPDSVHRILTASRKHLEKRVDGAFLSGVACKGCNATTNRRTGTPALRRQTGHYPRMITTFVCVVCQQTHSPSDINRMLLPKPERLRMQIGPSRWYCVRYKGGQARFGDDFITTANRLVTADFNPDEDLEAIVVIAYALTHAADALQQKGLEIPWKVVPTTGHCEPLAEWHGLPLTVGEQASLKRVQRAKRNQERQAVAAEVEAFKQEALARQRA